MIALRAAPVAITADLLVLATSYASSPLVPRQVAGGGKLLPVARERET